MGLGPEVNRLEGGGWQGERFNPDCGAGEAVSNRERGAAPWRLKRSKFCRTRRGGNDDREFIAWDLDRDGFRRRKRQRILRC